MAGVTIDEEDNISKVPATRIYIRSIPFMYAKKITKSRQSKIWGRSGTSLFYILEEISRRY